jgi:hypothetical protein
MANEPGAVLVVEIGSVITHAVLVDAVDGVARLIGLAEVPSTIEQPYEDATIAIRDAVEQIAASTGRHLLHEGQLLMPQNAERDGINAVVATTSAAGYMSLVVAAVSSDISARSALHASHATYTSVLQTITLNDTAEAGRVQDLSWIERQVQRLIGIQPDVVLLAGGLEDGAEQPLVRLAHIIGLTSTGARSDDSIATRSGTRHVIFAGNSQGREQVIEALSQKAALRVVDNLRPSLEVEQLEPARQALVELYGEQMLPALPGMNALRRLCAAPVRTVAESTELATRFLAEQHKLDVLTLDVGGAHTAAFLYSQGQFSPAVLGGVGVSYGIGTLLAERGPAAISRWLPFAISEQELVQRLLNKMLRPYAMPVTREDILIDHALAREALRMAVDVLNDERGDASYNMVVLRGGVPSHAPHPGFAALLALDALQFGTEESAFAVTIHLDELNLLAACGALALYDADAAFTVFDQDLLANTALATCVATLSSGRASGVAVEAELEIVGGERRKISVEHGQLGRLPLAVGQRARLMLRPASGVRIGHNAPGKEVSSEVAEISGSVLGVIIDARGRPLHMPENAAARQRALWSWLQALGAVSGPLPYDVADDEALRAAEVPLVEQPLADQQPSAATPAEVEIPPAPTMPPPDASPIESDLAKLRQTVENPPPKKGWFRK